MAPVGKADDAANPARMVFYRYIDDAPSLSGRFEAGKTVHVTYDRQRLRGAVDLSTWDGCTAGSCCEFKFPDAQLSFRFSPDQAFQSMTLDRDNGATIDTPSDATDLELYVASPSYTVKHWTCFADDAYDEAPTESFDTTVGDARGGANYHVALEGRPTMPTLRFEQSWAQEQTAPISAGGQVAIDFDAQRFYNIIAWSVDYGQYWARTHHCYGYGCCEVKFPDLAVYYRFSSASAFTSASLADGKTTLDVPADADHLELYFSVASYDIKVWYCGEDHSGATPHHQDFVAYDSNYADNYTFDVE